MPGYDASVLAISPWTWIVAGALLALAFAFLIPVTVGLLGRLKDLKRVLEGTSGSLNEALDEMRGDLDLTAERLAELREGGGAPEHTEPSGNGGEKG